MVVFPLLFVQVSPHCFSFAGFLLSNCYQSISVTNLVLAEFQTLLLYRSRHALRIENKSLQ